ncbi:MAG: ABC transporter ATP-binding protein [Gemmatimonadaceae bacterium]
MSGLAVRAESLAKRYRIPHPQAPSVRSYLTSRRAWSSPRTVNVDALRDVSFEVPEGEVFGIIGRNGAGKSTLLKILSRITTPSGGRATIRGRVASLLEVGTGFHPELTGRENVFLNGMLLGMPRREVLRAFDAICDFSGIGQYIDVPIKRYSSGMQLRLAFAVAAHLAADTMIIDEVLAVGDAEFQAKCTGAMQDAAGEGRTTLFVSHNMPAVENLCSRAMLLDRGTVIRIGTASAVVREYLKGAAESSQEATGYNAPESHAPAALVRFRAVRLAGATGATPIQGESISVDIELDVRQPVRQLQVEFSLWTVEGNLIASTCSSDYGCTWDLSTGSHRLAIRLPSARLLPRTHILSLRAFLDWGHTLFDHVPRALMFDVLPRDVLGHGVALLADRGVTWLPASFTLDGQQAEPLVPPS